ncbi:hypothetical protein D3C72_817530 [compost metagenome]
MAAEGSSEAMPSSVIAPNRRSISAPINNDGATDTTPQAQTCSGLRFVSLKPEARASLMENAVVMMGSS